MSKLGIHFPNSGFRNLSALWSIPWGDFVVLHTNQDWVPEIRTRFPDATILVRAYLENWATADPTAWAHSIARWAEELRPFGIELTFANEQNLAAEGHPLGARPGADYPPASLYHDILRWNLQVIRELRALLPWITLHFPALSQGHSDDEPDAGYVGFEILREAVELCDVLDVHVYWDESIPGQRKSIQFGERYRLTHALFPSMRLFVSEAGMPSTVEENEDAAEKWLEALPDYVTGACWFIWDSDFKNQPWILRDRPAFVQRLRQFGLARSAPVPTESVFSPVSIAESVIHSITPLAPVRYPLPDGVSSLIGYSHIIKPDDARIDTISEDAARMLLRSDLAKCLSEIERRIDVTLTTNQKAALLSLAFDLGNSAGVAAVLKTISASNMLDITEIRRAWLRASGDDSPNGLRRRQVEFALFARDVIVAGILPRTDRTLLLRLLPVAIYPAYAARWILAKQGRLYEAVGIWHETDYTRLRSWQNGTGQGGNLGEIVVRVEDENGVGIPAELVVRRHASWAEVSKIQWTDATGIVRFALDATSEFSPATSRGPDRIEIGDCLVSGLGTPIPENGAPGPALYFIRVRRNSQFV